MPFFYPEHVTGVALSKKDFSPWAGVEWLASQKQQVPMNTEWEVIRMTSQARPYHTHWPPSVRKDKLYGGANWFCLSKGRNQRWAGKKEKNTAKKDDSLLLSLMLSSKQWWSVGGGIFPCHSNFICHFKQRLVVGRTNALQGS